MQALIFVIDEVHKNAKEGMIFAIATSDDIKFKQMEKRFYEGAIITEQEILEANKILRRMFKPKSKVRKNYWKNI